MDIIKTGFGLSRTLKNVSRFREIVSVLSRNGFDEFIIKTGLIEKIPNFVLPKSKDRISEALEEYSGDSWAASLGYRLRKSFEDLGPGFVKLGQLLSTREDIFPPPFIAEMKKLQDQVKGIPFAEAKSVIEKSLVRKCEDVFTHIDEIPIGTASIGVVYKGQLKTGEDVVIKVRRPNIAKTIENDFAILHFVITQIEKVSEEVKSLTLSRIVQDFARHMDTELDYRIEALNAERLKNNIGLIDKEGVFYIPRIYKEFSTDEVLVMEFLDGIPFSQTNEVNRLKADIREKLERGINIFAHNLLIDGFFHADLHGGNFFLLKNGSIGLIDFGLVGILGKKSRVNLVAILYSLVTFNFDNLVNEFLEVAEYDSVPDIDAVTRDLKDCLSPYMGLTVKQINFSMLFRSIMKTLAEHGLYLPREWFVVFRALISLDGVGKSLDMDFDIFTIVDSDIRRIIKELVSKDEMLEEAVWMGRDFLNSSRSLPRHLRWFLREFARRDYAFHVVNSGYENELKSVANALRFLGFAFLSGLFYLVGFLFLGADPLRQPANISPLVWIIWAMATLFFAAGVWPIRKKE